MASFYGKKTTSAAAALGASVSGVASAQEDEDAETTIPLDVTGK